MYRTHHLHHLAEKRRQPGTSVKERQAVAPAHVFAWEFGGMLERSDWLPAAADYTTLTSLDKALALAG